MTHQIVVLGISPNPSFKFYETIFKKHKKQVFQQVSEENECYLARQNANLTGKKDTTV